ncbi:MAG: amidohydrolase family protein [Arenibacter sp.]
MRFDAHVHFNTLNESFLNYGIENEMRFLSIVTETDSFPSIQDQLLTILKIKKIYPGQIDFATTFSCKDWGGSDWLSKSLDNIDRSMNLGAVGVKVWKNIGMSLKDDKGNYVMIDHPSFEPIFQFLEDNNILLLGHNGEPKNCWLPTKDMTVESDKAYFMAHPEYHMFHHPEIPNYEAQLGARNNLLKRHPNLRFVGLHLASQEWDTNEVGAFLDQFPNAMVDLAERICHLQYQTIDHWKKIYDFFITYQDRIIYGSDIIVDNSLPDDVLIRHMNERYQNHIKYITENEWMTVRKVNGRFKGLGLPVSVVDKIYSANALKTYI